MICQRSFLAAVVAALVVAGCGGSGADSAVAVDSDIATDQSTHSVRRVLPLALRPESDIADNALPPVEVHDVGQDRMVNFRNVFPAERPVLLWMWAPY